MLAFLKTTGRAHPKVGSRVRIDGLVYLVTSAEEPDELDDETVITSCDIQPADASGKATIIDATALKPRRTT